MHVNSNLPISLSPPVSPGNPKFEKHVFLKNVFK